MSQISRSAARHLAVTPACPPVRNVAGRAKSGRSLLLGCLALVVAGGLGLRL